MKCSNCGGQYKTRELKCPYCGTENVIGHLWMKERSEAELAYERARKEAGKKGSIYVVNRIVNRVLLISTGLFVAVMLIAFLLIGITELPQKMQELMHGTSIETKLEQYYQAGNYEELYNYMDKYGLFSQKYYNITQSALLYSHYEMYLNKKYVFLDLTKAELKENEHKLFYLTDVLNDSVEVYLSDIGVYDELAPQNEKQCQEYRIDIEAFWRGSLGLSEEQLQMLVQSESHNRRDIVDLLASEIIEKEAWR